MATLKDCAQSWLAKKENDQCYPRISKYKSVPTLIWIEMNFFGSLVTTRLMIFAFALDRSHPRLLLSPGKNPIFFFSFFFLKNQVWTTTTNTSPSNTFSKKYAKYLIYTISIKSNLISRSSRSNQSKDHFLSKIIKVTRIIYKIYNLWNFGRRGGFEGKRQTTPLIQPLKKR